MVTGRAFTQGKILTGKKNEATREKNEPNVDARDDKNVLHATGPAHACGLKKSIVVYCAVALQY
jgi:hypothetical protein